MSDHIQRIMGAEGGGFKRQTMAILEGLESEKTKELQYLTMSLGRGNQDSIIERHK